MALWQELEDLRRQQGELLAQLLQARKEAEAARRAAAAAKEAAELANQVVPEPEREVRDSLLRNLNYPARARLTLRGAWGVPG